MKTQEALLEAFLPIARRKNQARIDDFLAEADRLAELDGIELLRAEVMRFDRDDAHFTQAAKCAAFLLNNVELGDVDFVQIKPDPKMPAFVVYAVTGKGTARMKGAERKVPDHELVQAWFRAAR